MQSICKHFISALVLFGVVGTAYADCWEEAGREFSIAPELLYAIPFSYARSKVSTALTALRVRVLVSDTCRL